MVATPASAFAELSYEPPVIGRVKSISAGRFARRIKSMSYDTDLLDQVPILEVGGVYEVIKLSHYLDNLKLGDKIVIKEHRLFSYYGMMVFYLTIDGQEFEEWEDSLEPLVRRIA